MGLSKDGWDFGDGDTGSAPTGPRVTPGEFLVTADGRTIFITDVNENAAYAVNVDARGIPLDKRYAFDLRPGTYTRPDLNQTILVGYKGTIGAAGPKSNDPNLPYDPNKIPPGYVGIYDTAGNVIDIKPAKEGGGGPSGSYYIPNALDYAKQAVSEYEAQISATNGQFNADAAFAEFMANYQKLEEQHAYNQAQLQASTNATNVTNVGNYLTDAEQRAAAEAARQARVAEEYGNRAKTIHSYLQSSIPGATAMTLPGMAPIPMGQFTLGGAFGGAAGDLSNVTPISQAPVIPYQPITAPTLPPLGPVGAFPKYNPVPSPF